MNVNHLFNFHRTFLYLFAYAVAHFTNISIRISKINPLSWDGVWCPSTEPSALWLLAGLGHWGTPSPQGDARRGGRACDSPVLPRRLSWCGRYQLDPGSWEAAFSIQLPLTQQPVTIPHSGSLGLGEVANFCGCCPRVEAVGPSFVGSLPTNSSVNTPLPNSSQITLLECGVGLTWTQMSYPFSPSNQRWEEIHI